MQRDVKVPCRRTILQTTSIANVCPIGIQEKQIKQRLLCCVSE
jgi:hypothetical protein